MNAHEVIENVSRYIAEGEAKKARTGVSPKYFIREICNDLGIFDWWNEYMSLTQLRQIKSFLETAISCGYDG